jgi:hypothetical protein
MKRKNQPAITLHDLKWHPDPDIGRRYIMILEMMETKPSLHYYAFLPKRRLYIDRKFEFYKNILN